MSRAHFEIDKSVGVRHSMGMKKSDKLKRREFTKVSLLAGAALTSHSLGAAEPAKRIRVGVIGCGSVSGSYLPTLIESPFAEVVSLCDIRHERAERRGREFGVANTYPHIGKMLEGVSFELFVNLTDMQEHEHLNRRAIAAGKHVWSEKPIANSLKAGQTLLEDARAKGVRLWGAPITVASPQFAFMAKQIVENKLGRLSAAHAQYGHEGPGWSAFFYEKGGGSMPDLAVYNLTSLTGLLGPAKNVSAMLGIVTPEREVTDKGRIKVEAEDNAMVLMDHGNGVLSHVQSGFNYFNPHGHDGAEEKRYTIQVVGSTGFMGMVGYDWHPLGVDMATASQREIRRHVTEPQGYAWQNGAAMAAECLATGKELLVRPEHALHVLEIMEAARESSASGKRIPLRSTFAWPVVL